jgi:hypothetical protein
MLADAVISSLEKARFAGQSLPQTGSDVEVVAEVVVVAEVAAVGKHGSILVRVCDLPVVTWTLAGLTTDVVAAVVVVVTSGDTKLCRLTN